MIQTLKGKVAVLHGGSSAEREVSLESGSAVFAALQRSNVPAVLIDTQNINWLNNFSGEFAHAFIALHGRGGEDGTVQGLLQTLGVTYTGSGVMASALAMDKLRTKQLWRGVGLFSPEFELLSADSDFADIVARFGTVMVKPAREGSSVGMAKVSGPDELKQAFITANQFDAIGPCRALHQRDAEFTVAVLGDKALPAIRLETDHVFYDYNAKYISNDTRYICPCGLSADKDAELAALGLAAPSIASAAGRLGRSRRCDAGWR